MIACSTCNKEIVHFDIWFQEFCAASSDGGHKLTLEEWMALPFWRSVSTLKDGTHHDP